MNRPPFVAQDFPGKCKVFPERNVMLLPFQSKWVLDNSQKKLAVKARQIGLSWTTAYRVVRQKLSEGAMIDDDGHTAYTLRFANGLRAHSMRCNAVAKAGTRSDRVLDEYTMTLDPGII